MPQRMVKDLAWLLFECQRMPREKAIRRLRHLRRWHEARLGQAEAQVEAMRTALAIIDDALSAPPLRNSR
jgi:hypothetical protein